jgi:hypothetical protein
MLPICFNTVENSSDVFGLPNDHYYECKHCEYCVVFNIDATIQYYDTHKHEFDDEAYHAFIWFMLFGVLDTMQDWDTSSGWRQLVRQLHSDDHDRFHTTAYDVYHECSDGLEDLIHLQEVWTCADLPPECMLHLHRNPRAGSIIVEHSSLAKPYKDPCICQTTSLHLYDD